MSGDLKKGGEINMLINKEELIKKFAADPTWKYITDHSGRTVYTIIDSIPETKKTSVKKKGNKNNEDK